MRPRLALIAPFTLLILMLGAAWIAFQRGASGKALATQLVQVGDLQVQVALDETTVGERVLDISVVDRYGAPVALRGGQVRFTMPQMPIAVCVLPTDAMLTPTDVGRAQARGPFFTMAGEWAGELTIERSGGAALAVPLVFTITDPALPAAVPADLALTQAGETLYVAHCASCHGAQGRGDGPAAAGLQPPPADFRQHLQPGVHSDQQIFRWIQGGVAGTAMPAWGNQLSEAEIWQLVGYLRGFAETAALSHPTTAAALPASPDASAPQAAPPLPLVYVRDANLWLSDGSGAPPTRLTQLPGGVYPTDPAVSPDGAQIAFSGFTLANGAASNSILYLINRDGSGLRPLWAPAQGTLRRPTWAPDGQSLYVAASGVTSLTGGSPAGLALARVDLATGAATLVRPDVLDVGLAPDGQLALVQLRWEDYRLQLVLLGPDGAEPSVLVDRPEFFAFASPRFAPDGEQLLFVAGGGPPTDAQGYPQEPSALGPLEHLGSLLAPPVAEAHGPPWELWTVNRDGSGLRKLLGFLEDEPMARFTPDGDAIVAMGAGGIYRISLADRSVTLLDQPGDYGGLDWLAPQLP